LRNDDTVLESVRYNGLSILAEICRQKKKILLKNQTILPPIIQALLQIISSTTIDTKNITDDDDEDEPVVVAGANHVLEAMSYHLSPEKFVPLVVRYFIYGEEKKKQFFFFMFRFHKLNQC
jgi:hypothetical protein